MSKMTNTILWQPNPFAPTNLLLFLVGVVLATGAWATTSEPQPKRPNILLIVAEDMSSHVGAFGDPVAKTPAIDALAAESTRYPNTFAVSGVCAPSRAALITGVHSISMGTQHMRTQSRQPIAGLINYDAVPPADIKAFPELLRRAGYATANLAKTDYQFGEPFTVWDLFEKKAFPQDS
jgi:N-sulfoglucosamine sulfohydrolase